MTRRTVYIVDDNADFLESAAWWLQGAGYDVETFPDPADAVTALRSPRPDSCLLLDVRMPGMNGLDLHEQLRQARVPLPVVYMSGHADVPLAVEAMRKGAVTFIEKPFADEALEAALGLAFAPRAEAAPGTVGAADGVSSVMAAMPAPTPAAPSAAESAFAARLARLTAREREVIEWVVEGKLNKVIADMLGISIKTVELHRKNAMVKLQARSVIDLMRLMVTGRVS